MLFEKETLNNNFASRYESGINFCISLNVLRIFDFTIFLYILQKVHFPIRAHVIFNHGFLTSEALSLHKIWARVLVHLNIAVTQILNDFHFKFYYSGTPLTKNKIYDQKLSYKIFGKYF